MSEFRTDMGATNFGTPEFPKGVCPIKNAPLGRAS